MAATLRLRAALCLVRARLDAEWSATALYRSLIARPAATRFIAMARDFRPVSKERSQALLSGRFDLAGEILAIGADEDPWDRPSPSYAFAVALHRFDFLPDLMGAGDAGAREALRLVLVWRAEFGQISPLIWDEAVLTRRTFNLVCAAGPMLRFASDLESRRLADLLARSARRLLAFSGRGPLELERLIAAAVAGCTLASPAGRRLKKRALARLDRALGVHFDAQGALVSRCPAEALERLFDLLTLEDALSQSGHDVSPELGRALADLGAGVRFFCLEDKRLAAFQGGEPVEKSRTTAALSLVEQAAPAEPPLSNPLAFGGYERLKGADIEILMDAAPPAAGPLSTHACAQPLAVEIVCRGDRLITNCGWSPDAHGHDAFRLTDAGSTVSIEHASAGQALSGTLARALGPRLVRGARHVAVERFGLEEGCLLVAAHDGWLSRFGLIHERRLYLNEQTGELKGEDRLIRLRPSPDNHVLTFRAHFHLAPEVQASLSRDGASVILRGRSDKGWRFRNDADLSAVEASLQFQHGAPRRSQQILLTGRLAPDAEEASLRWKLGPLDTAPPRIPLRLRAHANLDMVPTESVEGVFSPHTQDGASAIRTPDASEPPLRWEQDGADGDKEEHDA